MNVPSGRNTIAMRSPASSLGAGDEVRTYEGADEFAQWEDGLMKVSYLLVLLDNVPVLV